MHIHMEISLNKLLAALNPSFIPVCQCCRTAAPLDANPSECTVLIAVPVKVHIEITLLKSNCLPTWNNP